MIHQILIPKKGREFVEKYAHLIQPLLCEEHIQSREFLANGGKVFFVENNCDHFNQSYPWSAKRVKEASLIELSRIITYHSWGYYGFFKPSVAEVIQQIPDDLLDKTEYFLVLGPDNALDLYEQSEVVNQGYHKATTILYRRK